jgi:hypothetical protein
MTGYTTDKVSPSGQLEPPNAKDFPNFGSNIVRLKPVAEPMLPFVMLPRPLQESNVVGKGGSAGFLGKAFDPYTLFPDGDDLDMTKMDRLKTEDLKLPQEVFAMRLERRARLRDAIEEAMPDIEKATASYNLDEYYQRALNLIVSGRARDAFNLGAEADKTRDRYGRNTFGTEPAARASSGGSGDARGRGHLAEGRKLGQSLLGSSRGSHGAHEGKVWTHARSGIERALRGSRSTRLAQ